MRCFLFFCALWLFGASSAWSEDDQELTKARATFEEAISKQKDLLRAAFEREVTKVTRTGKLTLVQEVQREQREFQDDGRLPESTTMKSHAQKYKKAIETARERLEGVYERKVVALTKASKVEEAKAAQQELATYLEKIDAGRNPNDPEPVNEPSPKNTPSGNDQQAISLISAVWKYDGDFGEPGEKSLDATIMVRDTLFRQGVFPIDNGTLGGLDGLSASKSLYVQLEIFRVPVHLRLTEQSKISFGVLRAEDAKKPGVRMGNTRLELFEVKWQTTEGQSLADMTEEITQKLQEGPIEVRSPLFLDLARGKSKWAIFRFRAGPQTVEFFAADRSQVVFPMNAELQYRVPWQLQADETPLKVGLQNVKWQLADSGDDTRDVSQKAAALLNSRKLIICNGESFGVQGQAKGKRVLDLDLVINGLRLHLNLTEGSKISLHNATREQLEKAGSPLEGTPVTLVDVWWNVLDESAGGSGSDQNTALLRGPVKIEPPLFGESFAAGAPKIANFRFRVGQRILKIGAMTGSTIEIVPEAK